MRIVEIAFVSSQTIRINVFLLFNQFISDVEPVQREVNKGSKTAISCVITGLAASATVEWRTISGKVSGEKFTSEQGSESGGKQTSTLTVEGSEVNADTAYTCRVTSGSISSSGHFDTTVNLNVYGELYM